MWTDTSFFYTAYTGSAASAFGGSAIVKASGMFTTSISAVQRMEWSGVRTLIIDEISFMTEHELIKLDVRLHQYRDRNKVFGGYSLCVVATSDNSSEVMIMNYCITGILTSSSRVSRQESSFLTMNINSRTTQSLENC
jgi:hypothetical protein